jgi:AraC-like DNA-binding protein
VNESIATPVVPAVAVPLSVVVLTSRERMRALARSAFPRRRWKLTFTRTAADFAESFRHQLVDAALVDLSAPNEDSWTAVQLAPEFPSAPFFVFTPLRPTDAPLVARAATSDVVDVLVEGIDEHAVRDLVYPQTFSARFSEALNEPPPALALGSPLRAASWRCLVAYAGRSVRTDTIAAALGVTREHLSRAFASEGGANLKRVIDLVRLIAAAELSKNPGYDVVDVARVLGFASSSHLSTTSQRIVGTKPTSLARLRTVDLVDRFAKGRTRSRSEV